MQEDNLKDKAIDIKGKKYVLVSDRILYFNEKFPEGSITTELVSDVNADLVVFKATVKPSSEQRMFSAYSQATWDDGYINKTAALENAETSAVGRALAFMGIGVLDSVASADEVNKATSQKAKTFVKSYYDQVDMSKAIPKPVPPDPNPLPPEMYNDAPVKDTLPITDDLRQTAIEMENFVPLTEARNSEIQGRLKEIVEQKIVNRRNLSLFLERRHTGKRSFEVPAPKWEETMQSLEEAISAGTVKALMKE